MSQAVWYSTGSCCKCEFTIGPSPNLEAVAEKTREHKYETGHDIVVEDERKIH